MDKKNMKFFVKRVNKLDKMRSVSRREHKLIRKLLRTNKTGEMLDWEGLLFHFPGKRLDELQHYTIQEFPKYFRGKGAGNNAQLLALYEQGLSQNQSGN